MTQTIDMGCFLNYFCVRYKQIKRNRSGITYPIYPYSEPWPESNICLYHQQYCENSRQGSSFVANEGIRIFKPNGRRKQAVLKQRVQSIFPLNYSIPFGDTLSAISLTRSDTTVANAGTNYSQTPFLKNWGFGGDFFFPPSLGSSR